MLAAHPSKTTQYGREGAFAWHPRLPSLRRQALSMGPGGVGPIYSGAPSQHGRGATYSDLFIQGKWSKLERREGINCQELWVLKTALEAWGDSLAGKLVLVRMDNSAAASYANFDAGRVPRLTQLARSIRYLEVPLRCTALALQIAGRHNSIADALSRFSIRACGLGPYPLRELRAEYREEVIDRCGDIDVGLRFKICRAFRASYDSRFC